MIHRTPNLIEVLIHHHVCPDEHPRADAPAVKEALAQLKAEGILDYGARPQALREHGLVLTARGKCWLDAILATPLPARVEEWKVFYPRTD